MFHGLIAGGLVNGCGKGTVSLRQPPGETASLTWRQTDEEVYPRHTPGLMTPREKRKLKNLPTPHNMFWVPTMWFCRLVNQCMEEGRIRDEIHLKTLLDEVTGFKASLGMLYSFDWISIPLVYTQVTTIAVYGFFFACLMGRQYIENSPENHVMGETDLYVPFFTLMQFFFYMGWLKVAEVLINPFGEDEDDFETNWMIDRNYQVAMLGVDELYGDMPELEKDMYWDDLEPELPYTKSTICHKNEPFMGSTADFSLDPEDVGSQMVNPMETIPEVGVVERPSPEAVPPHSAVSSPSRLRHFLTNISSAFSQESIAASKPTGLHLKEGASGVRDPLFAASPVLQRVKSSSVKRSLSHTEQLGPHRRIGSLSNVDVSCGSMGQPIITRAPVMNAVASYGHSGKHTNKPTVAPINVLRDNTQRSLSSKASLAVNIGDVPLIRADNTLYPGSAGPCNPSGLFYKKPEPFELMAGSTGACVQQPCKTDSSLDPEKGHCLPKDSGTVLNCFYTNSSSEHPKQGEDTSSLAVRTTDKCDIHSSYINPIVSTCYLDNSSSAFSDPVHPSVASAVSSSEGASNSPVNNNFNGHLTTGNSWYSDNHPQTVRKDMAQCSSVWSQSGGAMACLPEPVTPVIPCSAPSVQPASNIQSSQDQVFIPFDKPTDILTSATKSQASLLERKADSEDSIDSTYDSSYDTVNSQEPLLEDSAGWSKHV